MREKIYVSIGFFMFQLSAMELETEYSVSKSQESQDIWKEVSEISVESSPPQSFDSDDIYGNNSFFAVKLSRNAYSDTYSFSIEKFSTSSDSSSDLEIIESAELSDKKMVGFMIGSTDDFIAYLKLKKIYTEQDQDAPLWKYCVDQGYTPDQEPVPFMTKSYLLEQFCVRNDIAIDAYRLIKPACYEPLKKVVSWAVDIFADRALMKTLEDIAQSCNLDTNFEEHDCLIWSMQVKKRISTIESLRKLEKKLCHIMLSALSDRVVADKKVYARLQKIKKENGVCVMINIITFFVALFGISFCTTLFSC